MLNGGPHGHERVFFNFNCIVPEAVFAAGNPCRVIRE